MSTPMQSNRQPLACLGSILALLGFSCCGSMSRGEDVYPLEERWLEIDARPTSIPAGRAGANQIQAVSATPIIDVHAHTFNARYLPIQNVLLGKRDVSFFALFLFDAWARRIASAIAATASVACAPQDPAAEPESFGAFCRVVADESDQDIEEVAEDDCVQALGRAAVRLRDERSGRDSEVGREERQARYENTQEILAQELDEKDLSRIRRALGLAGIVLNQPVIDFLTRLVSLDSDLDAIYQSDFENSVALSVSHMMDLAPVYNQEERESTTLVPFGDQIPCMNQIQRRPGARSIYFVAYNPFRDHWPEPKTPGRALEIVEQALRSSGAYGVKVYPPSGYRPAGNEIPSPPFALFTKEPRRQWKARYEGVEAQQLDERMRTLFQFCSDNDIPIFAHCNTGEFEARKGYGVAMADPAWWEPVLEEFPRLRLCFGHAGGADFWFGASKRHADWGRRVAKLCMSYENVYCEFGVHGQISRPELREAFVARLASVIESGGGQFAFEDKILYGSDWYMPAGLGQPIEFLQGYQEAFRDQRLIAHYTKFFFENALRYLDARKRLENGAFPLPAEVRERLASLLTQAPG